MSVFDLGREKPHEKHCLAFSVSMAVIDIKTFQRVLPAFKSIVFSVAGRGFLGFLIELE